MLEEVNLLAHLSNAGLRQRRFGGLAERREALCRSAAVEMRIGLPQTAREAFQQETEKKSRRVPNLSQVKENILLNSINVPLR